MPHMAGRQDLNIVTFDELDPADVGQVTANSKLLIETPDGRAKSVLKTVLFNEEAAARAEQDSLLQKQIDTIVGAGDIEEKMNLSLKGANNGVAELDANGKIPMSQIPGGADDVRDCYGVVTWDEFGNVTSIQVYEDAEHTRLLVAEPHIIYLDIGNTASKNYQYMWTGTAWSRLGNSVVIGESSSNAYRGDRGKIAYDHSQVRGTGTETAANPHGLAPADIGLGNVPNVTTNNQTPTYTVPASDSELTSGETLSVAFGKLAKIVRTVISHIANVSNPHSVTKAQVGLGDVENYGRSTSVVSGDDKYVTGGAVYTAVSDMGTSVQSSLNTSKQDKSLSVPVSIDGISAGTVELAISTLNDKKADKSLAAGGFQLSMNPTTYVVSLQAKDTSGNNLGTAQTIDLPLESMVTGGSYDGTGKKIVLTLQSGQTADIPIGGLISGLQAEITGAATSVVSSNLTAGKVLVSDSNGKIAVSDITSTQLEGISDIEGNIQEQLDNPLHYVNDFPDSDVKNTVYGVEENITFSGPMKDVVSTYFTRLGNPSYFEKKKNVLLVGIEINSQNKHISEIYYEESTQTYGKPYFSCSLSPTGSVDIFLDTQVRGFATVKKYYAGKSNDNVGQYDLYVPDFPSRFDEKIQRLSLQNDEFLNALANPTTQTLFAPDTWYLLDTQGIRFRTCSASGRDAERYTTRILVWLYTDTHGAGWYIDVSNASDSDLGMSAVIKGVIRGVDANNSVVQVTDIVTNDVYYDTDTTIIRTLPNNFSGNLLTKEGDTLFDVDKQTDVAFKAGAYIQLSAGRGFISGFTVDSKFVQGPCYYDSQAGYCFQPFTEVSVSGGGGSNVVYDSATKSMVITGSGVSYDPSTKSMIIA